MVKFVILLLCILVISVPLTSCKRGKKKSKGMAQIERDRIKKRAYTKREKWEAKQREKDGKPPVKKRAKSPF